MQDKKGRTAMDLASENGHVDIVKCLEARGAVASGEKPTQE